ncbi:hypothetical protein FO519_001766 [Halicephalobus sp. NKZ332]|nr:hypothetical protein FO519_001766 [Halicephalobus sp. NKZ332]
MTEANILGVIASGRMVQTNFKSEDGIVFNIIIENIGTVDHIVVFLTGVTPFPESMAGSVYVRFQNSPESFHFLGVISNEKPSAFFRISNVNTNNQGQMAGIYNRSFEGPSDAAEILVHVESANDAFGRVSDSKTATAKTGFAEFQKKAMRNFVNYANSFVRTLPNGNGQSGQFIPIDVVNQWYNNFLKRLENNPKFWITLPDE